MFEQVDHAFVETRERHTKFGGERLSVDDVAVHGGGDQRVECNLVDSRIDQVLFDVASQVLSGLAAPGMVWKRSVHRAPAA